MGRRSINTTKSGKFMNPTDQARKEARKKELKKNKKQRLLVRTAVLKNKDAGSIIQELDKLDEIEYNPLEPPALAEKVLKDKRRKLKDTLDRVMKLYQKDEPAYWNELRSIETDYERRRFHRIQYYEAVKQAENISVEDIPLPPSAGDEPGEDALTPAGILKHTVSSEPVFLAQQQYHGREPPGVPPGIAPDFDSDDDDGDTKAKAARKSVRFEPMDEMDKFMKELDEMKSNNEEELQPPGVDIPLPTSAPPPPPAQPQQQQQPSRPFFPPPPMPPMIQQRMQFMHPPPPHMMPPSPGPPRIRFNNRFSRPPGGPQGPSRLLPMSGNSKPGSDKISSEAMIQAKPQIRSLSADVTRFVPVSVKMKKDTGPSSSRPQWPQAQSHVLPVQPKKSTKDDAYSEFMKEMEGLL